MNVNYVNYGDVNFFEWGILVAEGQLNPDVFSIIICRPYSDAENLYQFGECIVDISDTWIDRQGVMDYIGMTDDTFDPVQFAIGCLDYYSLENFGIYGYGVNDWNHCTREEILAALDDSDIVFPEGMEV